MSFKEFSFSAHIDRPEHHARPPLESVVLGAASAMAC